VIPDTNIVMREGKGRSGVIKGAGLENGLGTYEKADEGPNELGLGGGDDFAKNDELMDGHDTVSTDRGKFEFKI
jgi:hypothetical protein